MPEQRCTKNGNQNAVEGRKVKLSMKRVDRATGADISDRFDKPREPRETRS